MDTDQRCDRGTRRRGWLAAGAVVAAGALVASVGPDAGGRSTDDRPDVVTVAATDARALGSSRPAPPVVVGQVAPPGPAEAGSDDGHVNAWAAGDEAIRRWLVATGLETP